MFVHQKKDFKSATIVCPRRNGSSHGQTGLSTANYRCKGNVNVDSRYDRLCSRKDTL